MYSDADASTDTLVVQVMEPAELTAGESYPLVLHGHGYGGSRDTAPSTFQQRLRDAGYYVISIDQRGFGESSGTVRVMSRALSVISTVCGVSRSTIRAALSSGVRSGA